MDGRICRRVINLIYLGGDVNMGVEHMMVSTGGGLVVIAVVQVVQVVAGLDNR